MEGWDKLNAEAAHWPSHRKGHAEIRREIERELSPFYFLVEIKVLGLI